MNWFLNILSLVAGLIPVAKKIGELWESSAGFQAILNEITHSPAIAQLEAVGAALWPAAEKTVQKVLAAIHLGYPAATKWIQTSLNTIQLTGYIHFGAPLAVDGVFGPKTFAAVVVLQAKLGLPATGAVTQAEYDAINKLIKS